MTCPKCQNSIPDLFFTLGETTYCRVCLSFLGKEAQEFGEWEGIKTSLAQSFPLSKDQASISQALVDHYQDHSILVEAVCGAGKTEMCLAMIRHALDQKLQVGWMCARRQVVVQLAKRLQGYFPGLDVVHVVGGHSQVLKAPILVLTAHQLYRFEAYFDLLIIDEPDAFPYAGNKTLEALAAYATRGQTIFLSATPDKRLIDQVDLHLVCHQRPSGRPLVLPRVVVLPRMISFVYLLICLRLLAKEKVLIFVPTIAMAKGLGFLLGLPYIYSGCQDLDKNLQEFINQKQGHLITTTILERGVTFEEVHVIVFGADHGLFDLASLIQISGRVGRSFTSDVGSCLFLCFKKSQAVQATCQKIRWHNTTAGGA